MCTVYVCQISSIFNAFMPKNAIALLDLEMIYFYVLGREDISRTKHRLQCKARTVANAVVRDEIEIKFTRVI